MVLLWFWAPMLQIPVVEASTLSLRCLFCLQVPAGVGFRSNSEVSGCSQPGPDSPSQEPPPPLSPPGSSRTRNMIDARAQKNVRAGRKMLHFTLVRKASRGMHANPEEDKTTMLAECATLQKHHYLLGFSVFPHGNTVAPRCVRGTTCAFPAVLVCVSGLPQT